MNFIAKNQFHMTLTVMYNTKGFTNYGAWYNIHFVAGYIFIIQI